MLLSMTGFGHARHQSGSWDVSVEIRTVNSRFLKIGLKCPEACATIESAIDKLIRDSISRGTVTMTLRAVNVDSAPRFRVNTDVLRQYWTQCLEFAGDVQLPAPADFTKLLELPGAVTEVDSSASDIATQWHEIQNTVKQALVMLRKFRIAEGQSMQTDLRQNCRIVAAEVDRVAGLTGNVVVNYRDRLQQRVNELLTDADVRLDPADLIREVSIFAERVDINEELTRLRAHLEQFDVFLDESESQGRKLEFLCQEMFREVNTIGAKANDVGISHGVVEMKAAIEKMREILQNVE